MRSLKGAVYDVDDWVCAPCHACMRRTFEWAVGKRGYDEREWVVEVYSQGVLYQARRQVQTRKIRSTRDTHPGSNSHSLQCIPVVVRTSKLVQILREAIYTLYMYSHKFRATFTVYSPCLRPSHQAPYLNHPNQDRHSHRYRYCCSPRP